MGSNPSPNGRSPDQGESRHYRTEKNSENWFFENSRVKEGESLYNRRRAPTQELKELQNKSIYNRRRAPDQEQEELQSQNYKRREKGGTCQPIFYYIFYCDY